ncbi:MAG TPA: ribonuclease P protein component [Pilimelia sp.]|nr:ribonuclease P protein component [Pilimelia sp.]
MLAAAHRLRRSNEFAAAVRGGRRAGRGAVVVHLTAPPAGGGVEHPAGDQQPGPACTPGQQALDVRAGFVVSRAVGGAVVRNAVRRRLRHLVADRLAALPPGATLIVRALPAAAQRSFAGLAADLDAALAAARLPRASRGRS